VGGTAVPEPPEGSSAREVALTPPVPDDPMDLPAVSVGSEGTARATGASEAAGSGAGRGAADAEDPADAEASPAGSDWGICTTDHPPVAG
jgi:hypothetical protein